MMESNKMYMCGKGCGMKAKVMEAGQGMMMCCDMDMKMMEERGETGEMEGGMMK